MTKPDPINIDPKRLFRQHFALPALPDVVTHTQNLLHDPNVDIKSVAELISKDPALVAQILKVVNSAYYGLPMKIVKVQVAVAFLGLHEICRMVLSISVIDTLAIHEKEEVGKFWFHSFLTALCTKYLAKKYEPRLSFEELWPAAILHDIGKLVCLKFFIDHYKEIGRICDKEGCLYSEAETRVPVPSSSLLGAMLCDYWGIPGKVKTACECHTLKDLHGLIDSKVDNLSNAFKTIVCAGNLLAVLSVDALNAGARQNIAATVCKALDYNEAEFLALMGDIYELKAEAEQFAQELS